MSVEIIPIEDHQQYTVNGHIVTKNNYGNWSCNHDLSNKELNAFQLYIKQVINNTVIKKHTKATYKG